VSSPYLFLDHRSVRTGHPVRNHEVSTVFIIPGTKMLWFLEMPSTHMIWKSCDRVNRILDFGIEF
jgi:hypothetical protein